MADQLTEEERKELYEKFLEALNEKKFQDDGIKEPENPNPTVKRERLAEVLKKMEFEMEEKQINKALKEIEIEGRDLISWSEILSLVARRKKEVDSEEELLEAFKVFDKEQTGYISANELRLELQLLGTPPEEIDELIKDADTQQDGHIQYEEFIKIICKTK